MEMLRALVESAAGFEELPPTGYGWVDIRWVIDISEGPAQAGLEGPYQKGTVKRSAPVRRDRTSGIRPSFLVDNACYALGLSERKRIDTGCDEHKAFRGVLRTCDTSKHDPGVAATLDFLAKNWDKQEGPLKAKVIAEVDPKDIVAFRTETSHYPFERPSLQEFWRDYLRSGYSAEQTCCCVCGRQAPVLRTLPWKVEIFGVYRCALSSFNKSAFTSFGKKQTANSPLCFDCASTASTALQYLVSSDRHRRALAHDDSKGGGKSPMKNQLAIFWLKDLPEAPGGELNFDLEAVLAGPMTVSADREGPPPDPSHADALYGLPWRASASGLQIARTRFYVAVLSPNKSRLVLRDWIDTSLDAVCHKLKRYDDARTIVSADGHSLGRIPVQDMLWALRPWKSRSGGDSANLVRGLVRTAYTGTPPPPELLEIAVQRFRVPVRPGKQDETKFEAWRQAQAAAIKLVLTYGTEEAITLQSVNIEGRSAQHLCGQLLAILEEAQLRASRWRINATLVDRFYGGASTSPSTTLGGLLKQATQAHMPKIRKAGYGYEELEQTIESVTAGIDQLGGFPATLTLRQQGEFALGFYLRRALFRAARPKREPAPGGKTNSDTERSQ
jgi:CRISPR-associated protein Csd1